jgi:hypothetical protein
MKELLFFLFGSITLVVDSFSQTIDLSDNWTYTTGVFLFKLPTTKTQGKPLLSIKIETIFSRLKAHPKKRKTV